VLSNYLCAVSYFSILFSSFYSTNIVRLNLDPFSQYDDSYLWKALRKARCDHIIEGLPGGLAYEVAERGDTLSAGQRQLLCLARYGSPVGWFRENVLVLLSYVVYPAISYLAMFFFIMYRFYLNSIFLPYLLISFLPLYTISTSSSSITTISTITTSNYLTVLEALRISPFATL